MLQLGIFSFGRKKLRQEKGEIMSKVSRKWSVLLVAACVVLSLGNHKSEPCKGLSPDSSASTSIFSSYSSFQPLFLSEQEKILLADDYPFLEYDSYRDSCPQAEKVIRSTVRNLFDIRPNVAPQLLRLVFHDCFIQGCDASVLLDAMNGIESEKDAPPNHTLKGFHFIQIIKSNLEEVCPGTVSCADILVLAAREGVVLAGGPFYPLNTGRRDSPFAYREIASYELPSPDSSISRILSSFAERGFNEREIVSLLGAHTIGVVHCKFFENRLHNYRGTGRPDPSIELEFLDFMRSRCSQFKLGYSSTGVHMDYEPANDSSFGTQCYRSLERGRGILHADQQLMSSEGTRRWVHAYAANRSLFRENFALSMTKLSSLQVLTTPLGQIRLNCSQIV